MTDYLLWGFIAASFVVSFFLGRRAKSYWFLLAAPFVGILVSIPAFLSYMRLADVAQKTGLAIVAVAPALALLVSFFNVAASLLGALAGVLYAKRGKQT